MLCEISRVECSKKLLSLRISRIIKMKIEIASDEKLTGSSRCKRQKSVQVSEKFRKMDRFARFRCSGRRSIDIEDCQIRSEEFESDGRHFK